jgi:hypothetical protein
LTVSVPKTQLPPSIYTMQSFPLILQEKKNKLYLEHLENSVLMLYYTPNGVTDADPGDNVV